MMYIDAKELREKGSIALLDDGALLKAIDKEVMRVLDDIEDIATDPEEKRKIKIEFTIKSNYSRSSILLESDISTTFAKKKIMTKSLSLEKAIDDEGRLLAYSLKEETEEAEGQQDMEGNEVVRDIITLPYQTNSVDAEFKEKGNIDIASTQFTICDIETREECENVPEDLEMPNNEEIEAVELPNFPKPPVLNEDSENYEMF